MKKISGKTKKWILIGAVTLGTVLIAVGAALFFLPQKDEPYTMSTFSMGSYVQQTVYGRKQVKAAEEAAQAIDAMENDISWRKEGDVAEVNAQAGKSAVAIGPDTYEILSDAYSVCVASGGAFDVTIAPVSRLWDFDENPHLPERATIEQHLQHVDYTALTLTPEGTVLLQDPDAALDLGSVGKGAACDVAVSAYEKAGADRGVVAVGGSVGLYGHKPDGEAWNVAVRDPYGTGTIGVLALDEGFISTSGSYEKVFEQDGVLYHHILDPVTGYPVENELISVTIVCGRGALSDALSTACFVLGIERSLPLLDQFGAEAVFITVDDRILVTKNLAEAFTLTQDGYSLEMIIWPAD